jgi:hypothetical protein
MRENGRHDDARGEHGHTQDQPLPGFLRPDIGELCFSDVHRNLPVLLFILSIRSGFILNSRHSYIRLECPEQQTSHISFSL